MHNPNGRAGEPNQRSVSNCKIGLLYPRQSCVGCPDEIQKKTYDREIGPSRLSAGETSRRSGRHYRPRGDFTHPPQRAVLARVEALRMGHQSQLGRDRPADHEPVLLTTHHPKCGLAAQISRGCWVPREICSLANIFDVSRTMYEPGDVVSADLPGVTGIKARHYPANDFRYGSFPAVSRIAGWASSSWPRKSHWPVVSDSWALLGMVMG